MAFRGVEARQVDVEIQFTGGEPKLILVGLGDKAVTLAYVWIVDSQRCLRTLRLARTIADLEGSPNVRRAHVAGR